jgi:hypothetical protein
VGAQHQDKTGDVTQFVTAVYVNKDIVFTAICVIRDIVFTAKSM